jgi:hypothetical protein
MRVKIWAWRFLFGWTPKAREIRRLAREFRIPAPKVFERAASLEVLFRDNLISIVRQSILDEQRKAREELLAYVSSRPATKYPERPDNERKAGARLSSY